MKVRLLALAVVGALAAAAPSFGKNAPIVARAIAVGKMQATADPGSDGDDDPRVVPRRARRELRLARPRRACRGGRRLGDAHGLRPRGRELQAVQSLQGHVLRRAGEPHPPRAERRQDARTPCTPPLSRPPEARRRRAGEVRAVRLRCLRVKDRAGGACSGPLLVGRTRTRLRWAAGEENLGRDAAAPADARAIHAHRSQSAQPRPRSRACRRPGP